MGLRGDSVPHPRVRGLLLARIPDRARGEIAVSQARGHRTDGYCRHHCVFAHRRRRRAVTDHRPDAAVHLLRPVEPRSVAVHDGDSREHREREGACSRRGGHRPAGRTSLVRIFVTGGGTGGHLYPALAIARALVRLEPSIQPLFIGARRGIERDVLPTTEFAHELLDLHPLYRDRPWENWRTVRGLVSAWRRIGRLVREAPPRFVVGTGGYAAGATMMFAARRRLPLFIQEQNSFPGRTVRTFSRYAREIYLGFPEGGALLP